MLISLLVCTDNIKLNTIVVMVVGLSMRTLHKHDKTTDHSFKLVVKMFVFWLQFAEARSQKQRLGRQLREREEEFEEIKSKHFSMKTDSRNNEKLNREVRSKHMIAQCGHRAQGMQDTPSSRSYSFRVFHCCLDPIQQSWYKNLV